MFIIYVIDLSTKNKNVKTGVCIFIKIKSTGRWDKKIRELNSLTYLVGIEEKIFFQLIRFRKSSFFIYALFQKMLNVSEDRELSDIETPIPKRPFKCLSVSVYCHECSLDLDKINL